MSHPCSATVWYNAGMHGAAAAAAKIIVGCEHHSLTMVRPAAVLDHSARPRSKPPAVPEEGIHAGSFGHFRYMLVWFELAAAVSSCRNNGGDYCCHRPCEPVPRRVSGKELADTTGLQNEEEDVSWLIDCIYLRGRFGGITPLSLLSIF